MLNIEKAAQWQQKHPEHLQRHINKITLTNGEKLTTDEKKSLVVQKKEKKRQILYTYLNILGAKISGSGFHWSQCHIQKGYHKKKKKE